MKTVEGAKIHVECAKEKKLSFLFCVQDLTLVLHVWYLCTLSIIIESKKHKHLFLLVVKFADFQCFTQLFQKKKNTV